MAPSSEASSGRSNLSALTSLSKLAAEKVKRAGKAIARKAKTILSSKDSNSLSSIKIIEPEGGDGAGDAPVTRTDPKEPSRPFQWFACAAKKCKRDGGVKRPQLNKDGVTKASDRSVTSGLLRHAKACWGDDVVEDRLKGGKGKAKTRSRRFFRGSRVRASSRAHLVRWVAESNRPLSIIEDREFKTIVTTGRPDHEYIKILLQEYPGQLSFATDAWTSPNYRAFCAWTVHLQHEGQMLLFPLDIVEVPESHTSETMSHEFHSLLERYGITHKILAWTGDNASSNDSLNKHLGKNTENSFDADNHVRCFPHAMNLTAKTFLAPFYAGDDSQCADVKAEVPLELEDEELPDLAEATGTDLDSNIEGEMGWDALSPDEKDELVASVNKVKGPITKIRSLAFAIINSPILALPAWRKHCATNGLRTVSVAIAYKAVINNITADRSLAGFRKHTIEDNETRILNIPSALKGSLVSSWEGMNPFLTVSRSGLPLGQMFIAAENRPHRGLNRRPMGTNSSGLAFCWIITTTSAWSSGYNPTEWTMLEDMKYVLQFFKDTTLYFSRDTVTSITQVITTMDKLDDMMMTAVISSTVEVPPTNSSGQPMTKLTKCKLHAALIAALKPAKNMLNKYYALTDQSSIYRIAMMGPTWIVTAKNLVRTEFDKHYATVTTFDTDDLGVNETASMASSDYGFNEVMNWIEDVPDMDELNQYLPEPIDRRATLKPLEYWWGKREMWPRLSRMTLDYLCVPGPAPARLHVESPHGCLDPEIHVFQRLESAESDLDGDVGGGDSEADGRTRAQPYFLSELQEILERYRQIPASEATIYHALKKRKISLKTGQKMVSEQTLEAEADFITRIADYPTHYLVCIDEMSKDD
uniref:HAT C-terminal dimerisation domain-containing protein n=1 Tax=Mycena chlorophos TaxID=658473 RepID=A0ABQ0LW23_MYCCL|nr:predicted protein [Mycena chlorophos]